jgi:hypothetical protein
MNEAEQAFAGQMIADMEAGVPPEEIAQRAYQFVGNQLQETLYYKFLAAYAEWYTGYLNFRAGEEIGPDGERVSIAEAPADSDDLFALLLSRITDPGWTREKDEYSP